MDWDDYFIEGVHWVAKKSKDTSTKVGCIIVSASNEILSTGYNGIPRGISDDRPERHERPEKYEWFEHAERNAVYNAARNGVMLLDSTCYITHPPCVDCARGLIQAGITCVIWPTDNKFENSEEGNRWPGIIKAEAMMQEAGIEIVRV